MIFARCPGCGRIKACVPNPGTGFIVRTHAATPTIPWHHAQRKIPMSMREVLSYEPCSGSRRSVEALFTLADSGLRPLQQHA